MMGRLLFALALIPGIAAAATASDLSGFAYQQRLGSRLPGQAEFREADGRPVRLDNLLHGKPLIVALVYFRCPNLCGVVRDDLFAALGETALIGGHDYNLVALSIDPAETPGDAQQAKAGDLARYPLPGAEASWHFLTGPADAVAAVEEAVGFRARLDTASKQFVHPAGIVLVTPDGVVSRYLLGVGYQAENIRSAVAEARTGIVARAASPVLLLCFHYDPATGRYTLAIMKVLRLAAGLTAAAIGGALLFAFRRERRDA